MAANDKKIMLPGKWEGALLEAQGAARERTISAFVRATVGDALVNGGFLDRTTVDEDLGKTPADDSILAVAATA